MPKYYGKMKESRLCDVRPEGWLRRWLEIQKDGLTGNLEVAGFPYDSCLWAGKEIARQHGEPWWPYEQTAYWIDGFTRCGVLLDDDSLIEKARKQMDYVLTHADADGYLGPKSCKKKMHAGRWSHMIFFRAMLAWASATGDERVIPALVHHYTNSRADYSTERDVCNVEIMSLLYGETGRKKLLSEALEAIEAFDELGECPDLTTEALLTNRKATCHGVTYCETVKQNAVAYLYAGKKKMLDASVNGMKKLDRYQTLVDGVPSSTERLRTKEPLDAHETCDVADYTWSAGYLLMATGDVEWADKIERACFNAAPGSVTKDFRALQYFSCPNQVIATNNSGHTPAAAGGKWSSYRPKPGTECCTGEINRIMPNYVSRMWMEKENGDPVAALYGPSRFRGHVGKQKIAVDIVEETQYPFDERIDFRIHPEKPTMFTLWLRIPDWCKGAEIYVNGAAIKGSIRKGTFVAVRRKFEQNDRVSLILPMEPVLQKWPDGGVYVEYGPLVYSLKIKERREIDKDDPNSSPDFPAWLMYPDSDWNYALDVDPKQAASEIEVIKHRVTPEPFGQYPAPIELRVPARKVRGWTLRRAKVIPCERGVLKDPNNPELGWRIYDDVQRGDFVLTPPLPEPESLKKRLGKKREMISLAPYGSTCLRVTLFPDARG
ncbi:MAG: beta-L-arabinofuranosidase domain-containing protein [Candidatus Sumerlaeia bacterium]